MKKDHLVLSWSGGKDSSLTLSALLSQKKYDVKYLLTTVTKDYDRISMHGVRKELLIEQAKRVSIESDIVYISKGANNTEYEEAMSKKVRKYVEEGIKTIAFGDLFLEDIRKYREEKMSGTGMKCIFPLWKMNTLELAKYFIKSGFKAIICTVDPRKLGREFSGKEFDDDFISSLPEGVDPCGENGEFHTFVYDAPIFSSPIPVRKGETVMRDNFFFTDIIFDG
ncbi:MAG: hypothetical protein QXU18_11490 [Thermoplasmatales archaeon]